MKQSNKAPNFTAINFKNFIQFLNKLKISVKIYVFLHIQEVGFPELEELTNRHKTSALAETTEAVQCHETAMVYVETMFQNQQGTGLNELNDA